MTQEKREIATKRPDPVILDVSGLHCASCVARAERSLQHVVGIEEATVSLTSHTARLVGVSATGAVEDAARALSLEGFAATPRETGAEAPAGGGETRQQFRLFLIAAFLTLPVFITEMGGHMVPAFHHFLMQTVGTVPLRVMQFVLTTLVLFGPGLGFFRIGVPTLLRGRPDMNALVALGAGAAWLYSTTVVFWPDLLPVTARAVYFEAAAVIVTLILLGRWLEARAKGQAGAVIARMIGLQPATTLLLTEDKEVEVPTRSIRVGDILRLRPGERVSVDGRVQSGVSFLDESMLTGEANPQQKTKGDPLTAGTVNGQGSLTYRAEAIGRDTVLASVIRMVEDAEAARLPVQDLVNRITLWFVPAVLVVAALTALIWALLTGDPARSLVAAVSVLIIACPCAMGLAVPVSITVGSGRAAEHGIYFRQGRALQSLASVTSVAFDKTGTLTEGKPSLTFQASLDGSDAQNLAYAAALEALSEHPVAHAIRAAADGLDVGQVEGFEAVPGQGVSGRLDGVMLRAGTAAYFAAEGVETGLQRAISIADDRAEKGETPILLAADDAVVAVFGVSDPIRRQSADAVTHLHQIGRETALISGDLPATAARVGRQLGIGHVAAGMQPGDKLAEIARMQDRTGPVAFVGDGINDAPALAAADVGIAIGTGTDVAIEAADVVLMKSDPRAVADAIALSEATLRNIRQNLGWAFGYNVILIPVAAGLFYPWTGWMLSPALAAGAMALSSVAVVTNALRLRGWTGRMA